MVRDKLIREGAGEGLVGQLMGVWEPSGQRKESFLGKPFWDSF